MNRNAVSRPSKSAVTRWLRLLLAVCCLCGLNLALAERVGTGMRVNNLRELFVTDQTTIIIDGELINGPVTRERVGTGVRMSGAVVAATATLIEGDLAELQIETHVRGPITALDPLSVLGQALTVTADTTLVNFATLGELQLGQIVEVSGVPDPNSSALATRIKLLPNGAGKWKLRGRVTALNAPGNTASIGSQPVSFAGVNVLNCNPLALGSDVDARATPVAGFSTGQVLVLTDLGCVQAGPAGTPGTVAAIQGLVSTMLSDSQFQIGVLSISHDANTLFRFGNAGDLDVGVQLEVEGLYQSATSIIASKIRFVRPRIRIEAPALVNDVVPGTSIRLLDELLLDNPQVRDQDGVYASGLSAPRQLEVRAYVDSAGQLFATRARIRRNDPRPTEIGLQGPVHSISRPNFRILGITVRTGVSTIFRDRNGAVITADAFFAALADGIEVEAENASYNSSTRELDPTTVGLADDLVPDTRITQGPMATGSVLGTVNVFEPDVLSRDGFD